MGKAPTPDGAPRWPSILGVEGMPLEYSWKWNSPTGQPEVRYTLEGIGRFSGTDMDPLNHDASREFLYRLHASVPSVDVTWFNHFLATLYDHDRSKYALEAAQGARYSTTIMFAAEFAPKGLGMKTYFIPRKLGQTRAGHIPMSVWEESLAQLDPGNEARKATYEFLDTPEGKLLSPFLLSFDNVTPAQSRLKFYFRTPHTSFKSLREILTLGGRISYPEDKMQQLRGLIIAATGIEADFPEDEDVPLTPFYNRAAEKAFAEVPALLSGYIYYFDMAPGAKLPEVKFYVPVRHYGLDDWSLARGVTGWMESQGRGQFVQGYLSMLRSLSPKRPLDQGKGIQAYLSCMIKKNGELDVTSYVAPEAFATTQDSPSKIVVPTRGTRRRDS
ncbi:aromatic prenyltransferase (DMATS family) [Epichloe festucae Fl1]|uniref:Aromatic prenyltransferase (DMATS family) n=1 Tax=Epichloe festucae (strain Fl1) TaxID=877507 RepID=A0A7S9KMV0_EPIFF|nr:aromatic prenyltransferase (DMATS family) [Epichloe festucae Fl1]